MEGLTFNWSITVLHVKAAWYAGGLGTSLWPDYYTAKNRNLNLSCNDGVIGSESAL